MAVSKVVQDMYSQLKNIHESLSKGSVTKEHSDVAIDRFLSLENEFMKQGKLEIDDSTRQKINHLIRDIKSSPTLQTMLGAMQAQFFLFLNRIEKNMKESEDEKRSVKGVNLERLDR